MPAALFFYVAVGTVLAFTHGHYSRVFLIGLTAFVVTFIVSGLRPGERWEAAKLRPLLLMTLVVPSFWFLATANLIYPVQGPALAILAKLLASLAPIVALLLVFERYVERRWARRTFFALAGVGIAVLIASRVSVLFVSPSPFIDVWTSSVKAVNYLLSGANPYAGRYEDIYRGQYAYFPSFPYLPAFLLWASGWAAVFGGGHDVRVSLVIAEALTVAPLLLLWRRLRVDGTVAVSSVLVWLALPISLFIVEQSWIDPLMVLFFAVTFWAVEAERPVAAGLSLALACGVKQYAPIAAVLVAIYVWRRFGRGFSLRAGVSFAVTLAVLIVPFFLWEPAAFLRSVVSAWSDQAPRPDSLSLPALVIDLGQLGSPEAMKSAYTPFAVLTPLLWVGVAVWLWRRKAPRFADLSYAITAAYALIFLCAKQAFCNYWGFMAFFALVSCVAGAAGPAAAPAAALPQPAAPASSPT